jgi:hypothetical protein
MTGITVGAMCAKVEDTPLMKTRTSLVDVPERDGEAKRFPPPPGTPRGNLSQGLPRDGGGQPAASGRKVRIGFPPAEAFRNIPSGEADESSAEMIEVLDDPR